WRIPLLSFLLLTPISVFLWRFSFKNVFNLIPLTNHVLYIYDKVNEDRLETDVDMINGINQSIDTNYKVRLKLKLESDNFKEKSVLHNSFHKIDSFILNIDSYNSLPITLERQLLKFMERGKEVISYTSFYENVYEALPIQSHNDSFYE